MNSQIKIIVSIAVGLFFAIYAAISVTLGDLTPLYILIGTFLLFTFTRWTAMGLLGLCVFFFSSFQVPVGPQPDISHVCGLLAVLGFIVPLTQQKIQVNKVLPNLLIGLLITTFLVIAFNALVHLEGGIGSLKMLITNKGGRIYSETLLYLLAPILAAVYKTKNQNIHKLVMAGFFLSITYAVMDLVVRYAPQLYPYLGLFMGIATDTLNYASADAAGGWDYTRFSGLGQTFLYVACGVLCLSRVSHPNARIRHSIIFYLAIALFIASLISGYRKYLGYPAVIIPLYLFTTNGLKAKVIAPLAFVTLVLAVVVLTSFSSLPGSIQRSLLAFPGVELLMDSAETRKFRDTEANEGAREIFSEHSYEMIKNDEVGFFGDGFYLNLLSKSAVKSKEDRVDLILSQNRHTVGWLSSYLCLGPIAFVVTMVLTLGVFVYLYHVIKYARRYYSQNLVGAVTSVLCALLIYTIIFNFLHYGSAQTFYYRVCKYLILIVLLHKQMHYGVSLTLKKLNEKSFIEKAKSISVSSANASL